MHKQCIPGPIFHPSPKNKRPGYEASGCVCVCVHCGRSHGFELGVSTLLDTTVITSHPRDRLRRVANFRTGSAGPGLLSVETQGGSQNSPVHW